MRSKLTLLASAAMAPILARAAQSVDQAGALVTTAQNTVAAAQIAPFGAPGAMLSMIDMATGKVPFYMTPTEMFLGGRDIASQIVPAAVSSVGDGYMAFTDDSGRSVMTRVQGPVLPSEGYAFDIDKYGHLRGQPLEPFAIGFPNDAAIPAAYRGTLQTVRIPGGCSNMRGMAMVAYEGRTSGSDFDPKGIQHVVSRTGYGRPGSWQSVGTVLWDPAYVFGDPTWEWDEIGGRALGICYARRLAYADGDTNTTDRDSTSLIVGYATVNGVDFTDWDGNPLVLPAPVSALTDLTAAKPVGWGAFTPGPGRGKRLSDGSVWFVGSGFAPGLSTSTRGPGLMRYNRVTRRLDRASASPPTPNNANESNPCETAGGGMLVTSRIQGTKNRAFTEFDPMTSTWGHLRIDYTFLDPQKAGGLCNITSAPGDPRRIMLTSLHDASNNQNLQAMLSYDDGRSWACTRSIYDNLGGADGATRWVTCDEWGVPLATPTKVANISGYSFAFEVSPGVMLLVFEGQLVAGAAGTAISCINAVLITVPDMLETRHD